MSIVKQTRTCVTCGSEFKVDSRSGATECWPCGQATYEAAEQRHATEHAAAMEVYNAEHADDDPFEGLDKPMGFTGKWAQRGDTQ